MKAKPKCCRDVNCERAGKKLPVSAFPRNKKNKDRLHSYCRECSKQRSTQTREKDRAKKAARAAAGIVDPKLTEAVSTAITQGARTREQIESVTQLPMDEVCDALAVLDLDYGVIRFQRVQGEARFYPVRAA